MQRLLTTLSGLPTFLYGPVMCMMVDISQIDTPRHSVHHKIDTASLVSGAGSYRNGLDALSRTAHNSFRTSPQNIAPCIKHGPDHDGLYFVWVRWSGPVRKLYIALENRIYRLENRNYGIEEL